MHKLNAEKKRQKDGETSLILLPACTDDLIMVSANYIIHYKHYVVSTVAAQ